MRKVAQLKSSDTEIEVWGDGKQTGPFYILMIVLKRLDGLCKVILLVQLILVQKKRSHK